MRRSLIVLSVAALAVALAACGGDSSSKGSGKATTTSSGSKDSSKGKGGSSTLKPIDVCKLVTDADLTKVGGSGTGKPTERPAVPDVQWDSCTWGEITSGKPVVIVQVQQTGPDAPVDALKILLGSGDTAKNPATPVSVGNGGKLYNVAILGGGGGGGVGKTISFTTDANTRVAVSVTGEKVDVPALTALATTVESKLG